MYDVITFGSATVDLFVKSDPDESEITKKKGKSSQKLLSFPLGAKILITELHQFIGGGGTNTAVSCSKMGLKTAFVGKIGGDVNGKHILDLLEKENVEFCGKTSDEQTGFSVVLDSVKDDRTLFTFKGVNDTLSKEDLDFSKLQSSWFYFSSMVGESYETLEELSEYAKSNKIKILFNPSRYLVKKGMKFLKKIIEISNILIMNKEEAAILTKKITVDKSLKELSKYAKIAVITDGAKGVYATDGKTKYEMKPRKIEIIEPTGAGDSFASAFLVGMIFKNNIEFSLQLGLANAESVITHLGAKNKLLTFSEAVSVIRENPAKIKTSEF